MWHLSCPQALPCPQLQGSLLQDVDSPTRKLGDLISSRRLWKTHTSVACVILCNLLVPLSLFLPQCGTQKRS
jgi:hypothetical protein